MPAYIVADIYPNVLRPSAVQRDKHIPHISGEENQLGRNICAGR